MRPHFDQIVPRLLIAGSLAALLMQGCRHNSAPAVERDGSDSLALNSPSIPGDNVPAAFTCDGADTSPALHWSAPPTGTKSFALILYDRDTPRGGFVHWMLFNLPPATQSLAEAFPTDAQRPDGTRQGTNDFGRVGYGGPCPPSGTHHYVFTLFALDSTLNLPPGAIRPQIDNALQGHILARGTLVANYKR